MSLQIISTILLIISIITLSLSTYGLGREEKDKMSVAYQSASAFTMIGASGTIISILLLIISLLMTPEQRQTLTTIGVNK